jgi:hypothetical protein
MLKRVALWVLAKVRRRLGVVDEKQLRDVAARINRKIDIPGLSEETEEKVIYRVLSSMVEIVEELIRLL